ncbi:MAG: hypothetical protein LAN71_11650 [Acidobacteriia bacterium]|nr:hypothetical protein [Terriglobia bacterium]
MPSSSIFKGKLFGKAFAATAVLSGVLLFAGAPGAAAHGSEKCRGKIARAEWKLDEAIEHHGFYSRQAEHQRHELREAQDRCRYESSRRDRRYRDFDHDRDHDGDRD